MNFSKNCNPNVTHLIYLMWCSVRCMCLSSGLYSSIPFFHFNVLTFLYSNFTVQLCACVLIFFCLLFLRDHLFYSPSHLRFPSIRSISLPRSIILYNSSFLFVSWILLSLRVLSLALALIIFEIFFMFVSCPSCWEGACGVCSPVIQCARDCRSNERLDIRYELLHWCCRTPISSYPLLSISPLYAPHCCSSFATTLHYFTFFHQKPQRIYFWLDLHPQPHPFKK